MLSLLKAFGGFLGGGVLDRVLDTVDAKVRADGDRDKLKADIIREHMRTRSSWLQAGGFWTLLLFAIPSALHYGAVVIYSILWCAGCAWPQDWSVAALPGVMAEWQGWVVLASIGGLGLVSWRK